MIIASRRRNQRERISSAPPKVETERMQADGEDLCPMGFSLVDFKPTKRRTFAYQKKKGSSHARVVAPILGRANCHIWVENELLSNAVDRRVMIRRLP
jgi:hypothetical protein